MSEIWQIFRPPEIWVEIPEKYFADAFNGWLENNGQSYYDGKFAGFTLHKMIFVEDIENNSFWKCRRESEINLEKEITKWRKK